MSYPLTQLPTWQELIKQLEDHDIAFNKTDGELSTEDCCEPIMYFERVGVGRYVVCFDDEEEYVMPSMLRSICAALKVDPSEFGLNLG